MIECSAVNATTQKRECAIYYRYANEGTKLKTAIAFTEFPKESFSLSWVEYEYRSNEANFTTSMDLTTVDKQASLKWVSTQINMALSQMEVEKKDVLVQLREKDRIYYSYR